MHAVLAALPLLSCSGPFSALPLAWFLSVGGTHGVTVPVCWYRSSLSICVCTSSYVTECSRII